MKLFTKTLLAAAIAASSLFSVAHAEACDEEELTATCIAEYGDCTDPEEGMDCCDGYDCFGYAFYKRCMVPPTCLGEWHDCSSGLKCCTGFTCALNEHDLPICQEEKIGLRTLELTHFAIKEDPEPEPEDPPNYTTTKETPVKFNFACLTGDPHVDSVDGLEWDCQSVGEHIILKSDVTQRQVQGRFVRVEDRDVSVMHGMVVQDEGNTPKVQISIPHYLNEGISHEIGEHKCRIQLFVDGMQRDLYEGSGTDAVSVTVHGKQIRIKYKESEMLVKVTMGFWNGCLLHSCYNIPTTDPVYGIIGSPDGNSDNDWMTRDGTALVHPTERIDRKRKPAYDYCSTNWCITLKSESLFAYQEVGETFDDYMKCLLPYKSTLAEFVEDVDPDILEYCGNDLPCIMDGMQGGIEAARETRTARLELRGTCNNEHAECDIADCCDGFVCVNKGLAGSSCSRNTIRDLECMVRLSTRSQPAAHLCFPNRRLPSLSSLA